MRELDARPKVQRTTAMLDAFAGLTPVETHDLLALVRRWLSGLTTTDAGEEPRS